jgi:hypothetical protein
LLKGRERRGEERREDKVEKVIRMLREIKGIEEEIERRGEEFTSRSDIASVLILSGMEELRSGIVDIKSLILLVIGVTVAFGISIISMI